MEEVTTLFDSDEAEYEYMKEREEKEKQIEKMAQIMWDSLPAYDMTERDCRDAAEALYNADYRKQSEVDELRSKYQIAVLNLQAIAQRDGGYKGGGFDEWSLASAFRDCRRAAFICLQRLGEETKMPNAVAKLKKKYTEDRTDG